MKQKCSKTGRLSGGFTLVELIVVIAILAILAGVAYPVYTGYINKANEAADLALLGQVNESFQSALYDVGYNDGLPKGTSFTLGGETVTIGTRGAVSLLPDKVLPRDPRNDDTSNLTDNTSLNAAFDKYYKGNEETQFKVFETLIYDPASGGFAGQYGAITVLSNGTKMETVANNDGSHTYTVTGKDGKKHTYTVKDKDIENFKNSSFGENMSVSDLMAQIDNVTSLAAGVLNEHISIAKSFVDLEALGITKENYPNPEEYKKAVANAVVFGVANQIKDFDLSDMMDEWLVTNGGVPPIGYGGMNTSICTSCAVPYALVTAYATSEAGKSAMITVNGRSQSVADYYATALNDATDQTAIISMLRAFGTDAGFKAYYETNGAKDLAAFKSAMDAISSNQESLGESDIYSKGFADEDLDAILEAVFGGGSTAP